jgi:hypothetical protein
MNSRTHVPLDCENGATALHSLASAFNCPSEALAEFVQTLDLEAIYQAQLLELPTPFNELLFQNAVKTFGQPRTPQAVFWFHLTRTLPTNTFSDGIRPLNDILESIWAMVISLVPDLMVKKRLQDLKMSGTGSHPYRLKTADRIHWGPYGFLVRDVAFHAERLYQHDYLKIPEIIEDICAGYEQAWGASIISIYQRSLVPCAVKFRAECDYADGHLKAALCYARTHCRGEAPDGGSVICFDGGGKAVEYSDILTTDYIDSASWGAPE